MNSNPKIIVCRMREIVYTAILLILAVLLIVCLCLMFSGRAATETRHTDNTASEKHDIAQTTDGTENEAVRAASGSILPGRVYTPGIYTAPLALGEASLEVEVTVDSDHINSIRLLNLDEAAEASYPLVSPSLDHIATQILQSQSLDGITSLQENRYTSQMLLNAISEALRLAQL